MNDLEGVRIYNKERGIGGYDPTTQKWRDGMGRFAKREDVERNPISSGRFVAIPTFNRVSKLATDLELIIGGLDPNQLRVAEAAVEPMPSAMLAMMRLSEFYCRTEGDIFQTIEVPLDVALKPLEFESPDAGYQKELEELYSEYNLDIYQNLYYIWLCSGIYGQAFPYEIWGESPEDTRIVLLPPKNVDVGQSFSLYGGGLSIATDSRIRWTEQLIATNFPPMMYNRRSADWNEAVAQGINLPIRSEDCYPVREKSLPFQRYAVPPVVRASRAISTRRVFEEMRRATVEGYKNQLWLFLLGDAENRPLPDEIAHLADEVEGIGGERTGVMVWTGDLRVEVIAPNAPDKMMANETYIGLTLEVFRKMGISLMVVSGERGPMGGSGKTGDMNIDISIMLERLKFKVNQMLRWERQFRNKLAKKMGPKAVKANKDTRVHFGKIGMEVEREIRERLLPAYQAGPLSIQTFLQEGGWKWVTELERKKDEEKLRELFSPPATYAQQVVNQQGQAVKEIKQVPSPGRPPNKLESPQAMVKKEQRDQQVKAGFYLEASANFDTYVEEVYDAYDRMIAYKDVPSFISELKQINEDYMLDFAKDGYESVGGAFDVDAEWVDGAVAFVNSYADSFGQRLEGAIDDTTALEDKRYNAYLYPQEGRHLAYMYGVQQAMKEKGARGWRRVLHPELSKTGPCQQCMADSALVHPITEGFFEFHPNGVCSAQGVAFYTSTAEIPVEIPVPGKVFDRELIMKFLRKLGRAITGPIQNIVRRVRSD